MDTLQPVIAPKDAISVGSRYFHDIMADQPTKRVLLEGLEYIERQRRWIVTLGFDSVRKVPLDGIGQMIHQAATGLPEKFEIVREFRTIHVSARDGSFIKMERA